MIRESNIAEGTIIITDHQTAGKGQRGNSWEAEQGKNLTFSLLLKPQFLSLDRQFFLNIISSLAVSEVLTHYFPKKIKIKWPNDIYAENLKISGILIQNLLRNSSISHSVIGIGVNINQREFKEPKATSLNLITGEQYSLLSLLKKLLFALEKYYDLLVTGKLHILQDSYLKNLYWKNEKHMFRAESFFEGEIVGIDEIGKLLVNTGGETKSFSFKEIEFVE